MTLVLGAGAGLGLWSLAIGLVPPRPALGAVLARVTTPPVPPTPRLTGETDERDWLARAGRSLVGPLRALGVTAARSTHDLVMIGRGHDTHLAHKAVTALAGLIAPAAAAAVLALVDIPVGIGTPATAGVVLGVVGFIWPDIRLRTIAARQRAEFRTALSAYLDLVVVSLAGGAGVHSALTDAANTGHGWAFGHIRRALETARLTRATPWAALRQLGADLAVPELAELAASVSLAGTEGARVRASLAASATSLRTHQLADADAHAQSATERMALPVTLLFLGFLIFIGYPALAHITTSF